MVLLTKSLLPEDDVLVLVEVGETGVAVRNVGSDLIPCEPSYVAHINTEVALSYLIVQ